MDDDSIGLRPHLQVGVESSMNRDTSTHILSVHLFRREMSYFFCNIRISQQPKSMNIKCSSLFCD
jgi:hypothetical protein